MSAAIAAWIAHLVFWALLPYGWLVDELGPRGVAAFLLLWAAGWLGLPYILTLGADFFFSYVAILDIALVFLIFKGDVKL